MISVNIEDNLSTLFNEKQIVSNSDTTCPREINMYNLDELLVNLRKENAEYDFSMDE